MKKKVNGIDISKLTANLEPFSVQCGWFENSRYDSNLPVAQVAKWQNEGFTVNVTDKMRKFFLAKGAPLKKTTTQIVIPARNFMDRAINKTKNEGLEIIEKLIKLVIDGNLTIEQMCNQLGLYGQGVIQTEIRNTTSPKLSNLTLDWRAQQYSSKAPKDENGLTSANQDPLRDSGLMLSSVNYKVSKNGT